LPAARPQQYRTTCTCRTPGRWVQLRASCAIRWRADRRADVGQMDQKIWQELRHRPTRRGPAPHSSEQFHEFRAALTAPARWIASTTHWPSFSLRPSRRTAVDEQAGAKTRNGKPDESIVYPLDHPESQQPVRARGRVGGNGSAIHESFRKHPDLSAGGRSSFRLAIPALKTDAERRRSAGQGRRWMTRSKVVDEVVVTTRPAGVVGRAGKPLEHEQMDRLRMEYTAAIRPA